MTSQNTPRLKRPSIVKNVSSSWVALAVNVLLSFFVAPFVVTHLGSVYYGIWAVLSQFTGYLWLFDFGVRESVTKFVAEYDAREDHEALGRIVGTALAFYTGIGIVVLLASVGLSLAFPFVFNVPEGVVRDAQLTTLISGANVAQAFAFNVFVGVLMGVERYYLVTRTNIVFALARTVGIVAVLWAGYGIVALSLVYLGVSIAAGVRVYALTRVFLPQMTVRLVWPRRDDIRQISNYSTNVLISNLGEKAVYATDTLIIGLFLPIASVSYYAIAGSLVSYLKSFIASMSVVMSPRSSALHAKGNTRELSRLFVKSAKASVIAGLPVCIGLIVLGERFIALWMGPAFGPASGQVLAILAAAYLAGLPYFAITSVLYGIGQPGIAAKARIAEGAMNALLSLILVQTHGIVGAAIGFLIPHVILAVGVLPPVLSRLLSFRLRDYYLEIYARPLASSVPFWTICIFIDRVLSPENLVMLMAMIAVGLLGYCIPCWFFALTEDDQQLILERITRRSQRTVANPV